MGRPEALLGLMLFGPARPENQPSGRACAVRQARWPMEAQPGGTRAIWAHAVPGRAGPLIIFSACPAACMLRSVSTGFY